MVINTNNYALLNERALPCLEAVLLELGLDIKLVGKELQFINPKRNDSDFGSASINTESGVWADFADSDVPGGGDVTSLVAWLKDCAQSEGAKLLSRILDKIEKAGQQPKGKNTTAIKLKKDDEFVQVTPVPDDAPKPPADNLSFGKPSKVWAYFESGGARVALIYRFDLANGEKQILPCTLWRDVKTSELKWRWKGFEGQRPLYNLPALVANPEASVLIVEGEKSADAAALLFPDHIVVTTMGGAQAPQKSDLTPLKGRAITIWPDADDAGKKYVDKIIELLHALNPETEISVMQPITYSAAFGLDKQPIIEPGFEPTKGWDAADAIAEGWTAEHIKLLPDEIWSAAHSTRDNKPEILKFDKFLVYPWGVHEIRKDKDGKEYEVQIASYIRPVAVTRNEHGKNWGLLLEVADPEGKTHEWVMPQDLLSGSGEAIREQLLNLGARIYNKESLGQFLMAAKPKAKALSTELMGWHDDLFILPHQTFGYTEERIVIQGMGSGKPSDFAISGTLDDWKVNVAAKCSGNSRLIMAVCISLSTPFLKLLNEENGGFHFRGGSSSGKTKTLSVAASIWGGKGMVNVWRATGNAIESLAMQRNDTLLILDELGQVSPQEAGDIAYTLGNGQQKARANRFGDIRSIANWRLLFISTGEIGLSEHVAQGGGRVRAGQEIRMLEIPSDGGKDMGVFEDLHGISTSQLFADTLEDLSKRYYGTAAVALLAQLTASAFEREHAISVVTQQQSEFVKNYVPSNAHGQAFRAASRFGLVAGVGEYCIQIGVLPWESGEAMQGVRTCFMAWLDARGGGQATEEIRALEQVRGFLERHGESRFTLIAPADIEDNIGQRTQNRAGFRKGSENGAMEYWVLPEVYKSDLCAGFDYKLVTKVLMERGCLQLSKQGQPQVTTRLPGIDKPTRVYIIKPAIFGDELDERTEE